MKTDLLEDPTEEELARDWTLSKEDFDQVLACRGQQNRLRFAVQFCLVRKTGRFLAEDQTVSSRVLNHLCRQLDYHPVFRLPPAGRAATETEHRQRILSYLSLRSYGEEEQAQLTRWLLARAREGVSPDELLVRCERILLSKGIALPEIVSLKGLVREVCSSARRNLVEQVADLISPDFGLRLDALLDVEPSESRSQLFRLKEYPPSATSEVLVDYLRRSEFLADLELEAIDWADVSLEQIAYLAKRARRYDVYRLKRFRPEKRWALLACLLFEQSKTVLDHLVELHIQYMTKMWRRARRAHEDKHRKFRKQLSKNLDILLRTGHVLLDSERSWTDEVEAGELRSALEVCEQFQQLERSGFLEQLEARYSQLRRYLPGFMKLPFEAEKGGEELLQAIKVSRQLDSGELKRFPPEVPQSFVPVSWKASLLDPKGRLRRAPWEIALARATKDALRSGDLYLSGSRRHVSFTNLIYNEARWEAERLDAYAELSLPKDAERMLECLRQDYQRAAEALQSGMSRDSFASIKDGRLKLRRPKGRSLSTRVKELKKVTEAHMPRVRIEKLLMDVDSWCGFTKALRPLPGYQPRAGNNGDDRATTLLAAVIAHGTNLGIAAMGSSTEGVTTDMLAGASRGFLHPGALKASQTILINYHHGMEASRVWGQGRTSSSDGQRFGIQGNSMQASFYPRYFGYYDRAITVLTHVSDQFSVFGTQVISCGTREALYVLDALLENDTDLNIEEHMTDTHGYTEQLCGLFHMLGLAFMPRIANLGRCQLYRMDRHQSYGDLDAILRQPVDLSLIGEQWDPMVRVVASLRNRTAPANVVVQRLVASRPSDRLAKAFRELGRLTKTIYILRYLHEPELRQRIQLQLNRGEARHSLARRLFFANQGEFRERDLESIMNKASCLSLLSNAVLVWNTRNLADIVDQIRASGEDVSDAELAQISPLACKHIIPNGTYSFR